MEKLVSTLGIFQTIVLQKCWLMEGLTLFHAQKNKQMFQMKKNIVFFFLMNKIPDWVKMRCFSVGLCLVQAISASITSHLITSGNGIPLVTDISRWKLGRNRWQQRKNTMMLESGITHLTLDQLIIKKHQTPRQFISVQKQSVELGSWAHQLHDDH